MGQHGGVILNMASTAGLQAHQGLAAYGASKAGLLQMTRELALELAPAIRVNAIAPAVIKTQFAASLVGSPRRSSAPTSARSRERTRSIDSVLRTTLPVPPRSSFPTMRAGSRARLSSLTAASRSRAVCSIRAQTLIVDVSYTVKATGSEPAHSADEPCGSTVGGQGLSGIDSITSTSPVRQSVITQRRSRRASGGTSKSPMSAGRRRRAPSFSGAAARRAKLSSSVGQAQDLGNPWNCMSILRLISLEMGENWIW